MLRMNKKLRTTKRISKTFINQRDLYRRDNFILPQHDNKILGI